MPRNCLFIIDPQRDFMPGGALGVPGADMDMIRLSKFLRKNCGLIDKIVVTLDSHSLYHISHPVWWIDSDGNNPEPFTQITKEDLFKGTWKATDPYAQDISEMYIEELERSHAITHTIWPPHCLIGTEGHAVEKNLMEAITEWEGTLRNAEFIFKGTVPITEHFGAFKANVPMASHKSSLFNADLYDLLFSYDKIVIAGEASSHCVASSIYQMFKNIGVHEDDEKEFAGKIIYLKDACSPVPGFESLSTDLKNFLLSKGVKILSTEMSFLG